MAESNTLAYRIRLIVMARAPVSGRVKTRLIPSIGSVRAAGVYAQLLSNTLSALSTVKVRRVLSCAPGTGHAIFRKFSVQYHWQRRRQPDGDLGSRMAGIISSSQRDADFTIIVGSDIANINAQYVTRCIDALISGHDIVLGATTDGGYGLIAMPRLHGDVFRRIPWSTDRVLRVTLGRARQLYLKTAVIDGLWDVDTRRDYRQWLAFRRRGSGKSLRRIA